jgi:hypothetical protein
VEKSWYQDAMESNPEAGSSPMPVDITEWERAQKSALLSCSLGVRDPSSSSSLEGITCPDQSFHLDALEPGILTWMNCTALNQKTGQHGKSYLGVYLYSAGCVSKIKELKTIYADFCLEFDRCLVKPGEKLVDHMQGSCYEHKRGMAWGAYVDAELSKLKKNHVWKRCYLEVGEFEGIVASLSTVHFGARYPLQKLVDEVDPTWFHLRMHSYVGPELQSILHQVQNYSINLRTDPVFQAALQYMPYYDFQPRDYVGLRSPE